MKDGNIGGELGARVKLFNPVLEGVTNPPVTPDIVVEVAGKTQLVIDAKYKPAPKVPDRDDINQTVLYGARYGATRVMVLHSERPAGRAYVEKSGEVGPFCIYNGMIDLSSDDIGGRKRVLGSNPRHFLNGAVQPRSTMTFI